MTHLTPESLRRLLAGTLPPEEARLLSRHLEGECAACEEMLAAGALADAADGRVDGALAAAGRPGMPGNDIEFARIERRLRGGEARRPGLRLAGAVAAAALVAAGAGLLVARTPGGPGGEEGVKGTAPAPSPVRLRFLVLGPSPGGEPAIEKGVPGRPVSAAATLQFQIEAARAEEIAVLRVPPRGPADVFFQDKVAPGRTLLSVGGRPAAYPLEGALGTQRFVLVGSEERLSPERLARIGSALAPPARVAPDSPGLEGVSFDVVEVEVR